MKHFQSAQRLPTFQLVTAFLVIFGITLLFLNSRTAEAPKLPSLPTPTPALYPVQVADVHSEDGSMTIATKANTSGNRTTYIFSTGITSNSARSEAFSKAFTDGGTIAAPPNSWSPDNSYFYLTKRENGSLTAYVFKASGASFYNGSSYLDIGAIWSQRQYSYQIKDITGWDSSTLLHVLTTTTTGEDGPSFWFDIPSHSFIQLATK